MFTLAAIMMLLFFLASHYDRYFFLLHFLEALIYIAVLLLLFYRLEEWAYVIGFLAPLFWVVLTLLSGTLLHGFNAMEQLLRLEKVTDPLDAVIAMLLVTALALATRSARVFWNQVWGSPGALRPVLGGIAVVAVYYLVIVATLWRMVTPTG
ncbi:MAG: hypothetical protein ACE5IP_09230 [Terriglobia bacterium]